VKEIPVIATTPGHQLLPAGLPRLAAGSWRVDPARSYASFAARAVGRPVLGRVPLTGRVLIAEPIEDSTARLAARTSAISTGSPLLDRLLAGPGFLDAVTYPEISFRSDLLAWVQAGWRTVGCLNVRAPSMNWPASSICTSAAPGRTAPRASLSLAAGSSTRGG
jgi:hypothetical protein